MNQMKGLASRALAETSAQLAESCEALTEMGYDGSRFAASEPRRLHARRA